jgi:hypothetical protein
VLPGFEALELQDGGFPLMATDDSATTGRQKIIADVAVGNGMWRREDGKRSMMQPQVPALTFAIHVLFAIGVAWLVAIDVVALEAYVTKDRMIVEMVE